tara:strand:- start:3065 stop:3751 length:687 start_codon:yes stop_codon:yes gene_type:complete
MTTIDETQVGTETNEATETSTSEEVQSQARTFNQEEVDAIVKTRLAKQSKKYDDVNITEYRSLKAEQEKQKLEEQKNRGEFESILSQQKSEFDERLNSVKSKLHSVQVDGALLKAAGGRNAVSPEQVAMLLRDKVTLTDDGEVHVLNDKGEVMYDTDSATPTTVESLVNNFLDASPHFLRAGPSGAGAMGSVGETTTNAVDISKLDMTNPADRKTYKELMNAGKLTNY